MEKNETRKSFFETLKQYIAQKVEYHSLDLTEKLSLLAGRLLVVIFVAILSLIIFLLLMVLLNNLLVSCLGIPWLATLIEIGFVSAITLFVWFKRETLIIKPVSNAIIGVLFDKRS